MPVYAQVVPAVTLLPFTLSFMRNVIRLDHIERTFELAVPKHAQSKHLPTKHKVLSDRSRHDVFNYKRLTPTLQFCAHAWDKVSMNISVSSTMIQHLRITLANRRRPDEIRPLKWCIRPVHLKELKRVAELGLGVHAHNLSVRPSLTQSHGSTARPAK